MRHCSVVLQPFAWSWYRPTAILLSQLPSRVALKVCTVGDLASARVSRKRARKESTFSATVGHFRILSNRVETIIIHHEFLGSGLSLCQSWRDLAGLVHPHDVVTTSKPKKGGSRQQGRQVSTRRVSKLPMYYARRSKTRAPLPCTHTHRQGRLGWSG